MVDCRRAWWVPPSKPARYTTMWGEKSTPPPDPTDPPRRRVNTREGHGTYAKDRPPLISLLSRETGEQRWWVCERADLRTGRTLIAEHVPAGRTLFSTDASQS